MAWLCWSTHEDWLCLYTAFARRLWGAGFFHGQGVYIYVGSRKERRYAIACI